MKRLRSSNLLRVFGFFSWYFFSIDFLYMDDGEYPISCEMEKILISNFPSDKQNLVRELILLINLHCKK